MATSAGGVRRGPRGGDADTRGDILRAAEALFIERGFARTSIRGIAGLAGVDPSLVRHYFDDKAQIFIEAMRPLSPEAVQAISATPGLPDQPGHRLAAIVFGVWERPEIRARLTTVLTTAMVEPEIGEKVRTLLATEVIGHFVELPDSESGAETVTVCFSALAGVVAMRHILKLEPLASAPFESLVATYGPVLEMHLQHGLVRPGE